MQLPRCCPRSRVHSGELTTADALWLPPRRPGVLTVAIAADGRLSALHDALVAGLQEAIGFEPEARVFRPHVTVGRVPRNLRLRPPSLAAPPQLTFAAPSMTLYRSRTQPGGARYEPVAIVALAGDRRSERPATGWRCTATPAITSATPAASSHDGICVRTTMPTIVATAGSSATISA